MGKTSGLPDWVIKFIVAFAAGVLAKLVADAILHNFWVGVIIGIFVLLLVLAIAYLGLPRGLRLRRQQVVVEIAPNGTLVHAKWDTQVENQGGLVKKRLHSFHSGRASLANVNVTAHDDQGVLPAVTIRTQELHWLDFYINFRQPLGRAKTYSYSWDVSNITGFFDLGGPCSWRYTPYEPVDQFQLQVHHPPSLKVASATMTDMRTDQPIAVPDITWDGRRETIVVQLQGLSPGRYVLEWQYTP